MEITINATPMYETDADDPKVGYRGNIYIYDFELPDGTRLGQKATQAIIEQNLKDGCDLHECVREEIEAERREYLFDQAISTMENAINGIR